MFIEKQRSNIRVSVILGNTFSNCTLITKALEVSSKQFISSNFGLFKHQIFADKIRITEDLFLKESDAIFCRNQPVRVTRVYLSDYLIYVIVRNITYDLDVIRVYLEHQDTARNRRRIHS